eukprot:1346874-Karenia_brevis.AAC.1
MGHIGVCVPTDRYPMVFDVATPILAVDPSVSSAHMFAYAPVRSILFHLRRKKLARLRGASSSELG